MINTDNGVHALDLLKVSHFPPNIASKIQSVTPGVSTKSFPDQHSCAAIGPRGGDTLWQRHDAECQSNVTLPFTSVC